MLFNSIDFVFFLPLVFCLYWFVFKNNLRSQNALIVVASYVFYGWWDWRFLSLIAFSTILDFFVGVQLGKQSKPSIRKLLLVVSILVNLGFLGFFKYYNFFLDNFAEAFTFLGYKINAASLEIILPVGISFYTFQTLSYSIDVYRKQLSPTKDFIAFSAFVSFFPQLVAGPIERASNLLPQFYLNREFKYQNAVDGLRQILWGLVKKVVIADSCAVIANQIFNNYTDFSGPVLVVGAIAFTFQIYGDFSGYSDIAIGLSRLFGFELKQNFAFPYFSRDIAEFWRRWHISLSTWFRDYLYIPLGGSKGSKYQKIRNTFIIFLVSGFWHGANWTFIVWGGLNALYFLPLLLTDRNRRNLEVINKEKTFPGLKNIFSIVFTFCLVVVAWVFFRSPDVSSAVEYIKLMMLGSLNMSTYPLLLNYLIHQVTIFGLILLILFIIIEWYGRTGKYALECLFLEKKKSYRMFVYYSLVILVIYFSGSEQEFIYFQF